MKPFNLAEARIAERIYCQECLNRHLKTIALLVVLTLLVAVGSYACRLMVTGKETQAVSELADAHGRAAQIKGEISALESELGQQDWKRQLAVGSKRCLGVLESVLGCVPHDVWLQRIASSQKDSTVTVEGSAASFVSLSRFVGALRRNRSFSDVRLGATETVATPSAAYVRFEVIVKLNMPANAEPAEEPTKQAGRLPKPEGAF